MLIDNLLSVDSQESFQQKAHRQVLLKTVRQRCSTQKPCARAINVTWPRVVYDQPTLIVLLELNAVKHVASSCLESWTEPEEVTH